MSFFRNNAVTRRYRSDLVSALGRSDVAVEVEKELTSTNEILFSRAENGEHKTTVLASLSQTAGRGRLGRSFSSAPGGVYVSLLQSAEKLPDPAEVTIRAAVAVALACEEAAGQSLGIKWVNDIYKDGKKVAGILAQCGRDKGGKPFTVLGVGVNLTTPKGGFPSEIKNVADSLFNENPPVSPGELAGKIVAKYLDVLENMSGDDLYEEYTKRSVTVGKRVTVTSASGAFTATARKINPDYSLSVTKDDGETVNVFFGDVSLSPDNGKR